MIEVTPDSPPPAWLAAALALTRSPALPLTLRKKLGKTLPNPAGQGFRAQIFEAVFQGRTGTHLDDKIWLYGLHEAATIRLMRAILAQDRAEGRSPVLLDIGTNAGLHLLACAGLCDRALGFEPWEPIRARAEANLAASHFTHAKVLPFGLGEADADLPFSPPDGTDNHGVGSFAREGGTLTLKVRRGDDVIAEEAMSPTLLKIDTEGFERPVLRGLRETLARHRPAIVFELGGPTEERAALARDVPTLLPEGYALHGLRRSRETPALFPLRPGDRCENALAWPPGRRLP